MKRTGRRKEGFTLIEVVVSIAILGLVSIPFCNSLMVGYRSATSADSLLNSHLEATSIVEELMADGISVTETTDDTGSSITSISVNDIVIDTSDTTYSGYSAEISSTEETITTTDEDGTETKVGTGNYSTTITCSYTKNNATYAYAASFDSTEDYISAAGKNSNNSDSESTVSIKNIYSCTYTDSDNTSYNGICFQIPTDNTTEDDATTYIYIMNFNCEFTAVDEDGSVEEDDDVLTLVFAPNSEYPAAEEDSNGSGSTDEGPYWYDVAVSQGNVNINTSIRLADQEEDSGDEGISATITYADETTESGTYYASLNTFISSDGSTSYTVAENDDTVILTDSDGNSTEYDVTVNDDGSQTWTAS